MSAEKLKLDLPLLLPGVPDEHDGCVGRLIEALKSKKGVVDAHVARSADGDPAAAAQLCIHYDAGLLSLQRVRELASTAGAALSERIGHVVVRGRTAAPRSLRTAAARIGRLAGVLEAAPTGSGSLRVEFDKSVVDAASLERSLRDLGLQPDIGRRTAPDRVSPRGAADPGLDHDHDHGHDHGHGHWHGHLPATLPASASGGTQRHDDHDHAEHGKNSHDHTEHGDGDHSHQHEHGGPFGEKSELIFAVLAGVCVLAGWLLVRFAGVDAKTGLLFYIAAYVFGGWYTLREAIENIRAKRFEIDTLMLVAAAGAAALGAWAEGGLLLFLFSLGHSLEHDAMGRARKAIEALAKLAPDRAVVRRDGKEVEVDVAELKVHDVVLVRPNERLPADGFVVSGTSSVNQAPVTGESVPVDKQPVPDAKAAAGAFDRLEAQHRVFAGTINGGGALEVQVARIASESTMARVVKLVTEGEAERSPTQNFTERFERYFVPAVLSIVGLLLFAWVVVDEPFSASFYRAMAVLVAASPCALAISVPSAVLSGVARAGRDGVLIKGGGPLENLGTLTAIAFDKTGTLTEGKPKLTDVRIASGVSESELLSVALAVESRSDHPLAAAVVRGAQERLGQDHPALEADDVRSVTGRGVSARIAGQSVHIGKSALFGEIEGNPIPADVEQIDDELVANGRTTMLVRHGDRYLGVLGLMDTPRPAAKGVIEALKKLGIERLIMISGDNQRVAEAVARSVGLTEARGDLMPEAKVGAIKDLQAKVGKVAMVGDGVNDAPAMANATVGIAMGAAGSDVALETADVALMADDLSQLPFAVGLSRQTSRIIRQNLWVSLGVVAVLIPATIFGLQIGVAVLFHEGSTLLVVVNALRLLSYSGASSHIDQQATQAQAATEIASPVSVTSRRCQAACEACAAACDEHAAQ